MSFACIDLGSNTTRLLVAEVRDGRLCELRAERAFTRLGRCLDERGLISAEKIGEAAEVVAGQWARAREMGPCEVAVVATAAIRDATNGEALVTAISERSGLPVEVLSDSEEARLAFVGATRTLAAPAAGRIAVLDVGGGSSEVAVGTLEGGFEWFASCRVGSGLADAYLRSDPPAASEIAALRRRAVEAFAAIDPPPVEHAVAVGGSATSLRRLVGEQLTAAALERAIDLLATHPSEELARRFDLDPQRARLLPAGVVILDELGKRLEVTPAAGRGGVREGVIFEMALGERAGVRG